MDQYIFTIFGYQTNKLLDDSARKIQKAYLNYKDYQIKKRLDIIKKKVPQKFNNDYNQEIEYWNSMRNFIKYENKNYMWVNN